MDVDKEFFGASDDREGGNPKVDASKRINAAVKELARVIDAEVPTGRQKSIAFTELESVQMRSNRGIFYEG